MSRNDSGCGCLGQFAVMGVIFLIFVIVDAYNKTEFAQMRDARQSGSYGKYELYLDSHPNGSHIKEAYDSICAIVARDTSYFSMDNLSHLISRRSNETELINRLKMILDNKVDMLLRRTESLNTESSWISFVHRVPEEYKEYAQIKQREFEDKQNSLYWNTESKAWEQASSIDKVAGYNKYMRLYPKGKHFSQAEKRSIDLEVEKVFSGEHGSLPQLSSSGYGGKNTSSIEVENRTSYTLTILYSGNVVSRKLEILPGKFGKVVLPNGTYRVSANVNTTNVIPFAGTEHLTGSEYNSSYYISTTRY